MEFFHSLIFIHQVGLLVSRGFIRDTTASASVMCKRSGKMKHIGGSRKGTKALNTPSGSNSIRLGHIEIHCGSWKRTERQAARSHWNAL